MAKRNQNLSNVLFLLIFLCHQVFAQVTSKEVIWTADWSPDEKYIAIGGNLDTLKIYTSKNLRLHAAYPIKNTITCIRWHPHKNMLAFVTQSSSDHSGILDIKSNTIIPLKGISSDGARGLDWHHGGDLLAIGDNDGKISLFDINGQWIRAIQQENTKSITAIDWHPSDNIFVTVGDKIRIFDIGGSLLNTITHRSSEVLLLSVAWHNSGDFFVTGDYGDSQRNESPMLQFWNRKGDLLRSIGESQGEYRNLRWNAKGTRLASTSDALRIWDKGGDLRAEGQSKDYLWGLSWNRRGNRLVTSSIAQSITIWDDKAKKRRII